MKLHLRTGYAIGLESGCFESQVLVGRDPLAGLVYQQRLCRGTLRALFLHRLEQKLIFHWE